MPLSGIGFGEMLVIAMLVLIVFGPQRLPEITRSVGKAMREFKRGMNEIQRELEVADRQQKWGSTASTSTSASSSPAGAAAAAGPTAAATAAAAAQSPAGDAAPAPAEGADAASGDGVADAAAEPVIAPPTFGSDLPEEIEAQVAPPHEETAVKIPLSTPSVAPGDAPAGAETSPEPDDSARRGRDQVASEDDAPPSATDSVDPGDAKDSD